MNWRNVRLIFLREVRDQLRDRRTLFMIAVLPLLLYPSLGVGILQMSATLNEQPRTVVLLGADQLPGPPLIRDGRFLTNWFENPAGADRLHVVTERTPAGMSPGPEREAVERQLAAAEAVREARRDVDRLDAEARAATAAGDDAKAARLSAARDEAARISSERLADGGMQVLILVPDGMREKLAEADARLRDGHAEGTGTPVEIPSPTILYNVADERALVAYTRVNAVYERWKEQVNRNRLRQAHLPESFPSQLDARTVDLARPDERAASVWSKVFPALLVLMTVTGAFYPAVDLAAGEKERGTMETLLICPASRTQIVLGKFLTVMLFSIGTAFLNLASMGFTGKYMASFAGSAVGRMGTLSPPPLASLVWVAVLMVPLAALFSALCLSLATFARSTKEGQYYLTPLLLVTIGLTVFCLSPSVEITPLYSILPVIGPAVLLRELLSAGGVGRCFPYLAPVLITSFGYAALALWWAIEQFRKESVLFREAERFDLRLWLRHLMRDKEDTPSFSEAGLLFVVIMLLQFGAMKFLRDALLAVSPDQYGVQMVKLLMVQQLATIATPALLMGLILTRSPAKTFRVRLPAAKFVLAAAVLPIALQPLCMTLVEHLQWFLGELSPEIRQQLALMQSDSIPVWLSLAAFAFAPAVCEEVAFRGFVLSGFLRSKRTWLAIGLSSLCFGVMHMIPQQVFNATLVGLVIGLLAVRSGSLWPGVLFHFLFNGSQVLLGKYGPAAIASGRFDAIVRQEGDGLVFSWPTLLLCGGVAAVLIRWLVVTGVSSKPVAPRRPIEDLPKATALRVGS